MQVGAIKFMDRWIGAPLCYFFGLIKIPWKLNDPKKILVIQLWGIGESILTLPAIESLRKKYPQSRIEVLATSRNCEVYRKNKEINSVKVLDTSLLSIAKFCFKNAKKYDLVIDMEEYLNVSALICFMVGLHRVGFSHGARSLIYHRKVAYNDSQHAVLTFLDLVGSIGGEKGAKKLSALPTTPKDRKKAKEIVKGIGGPIVVIAPGAAESARCRMWPIENYAELSDHLLRQKRATILFSGSADEKELVNSIISKMEEKGAVNLCGKLTLTELFALLLKVDLFIGNDSGPMHIAAAQGVKTIGLFGPNTPVRFGPFGEGNVAIYKKESCEFSPCVNVHLGEVPDCLYPRASKEYQKCMKAITAMDVISEVERVLK